MRILLITLATMLTVACLHKAPEQPHYPTTVMPGSPLYLSGAEVRSN
jgi:hypothetical protein